MEHAFTKAELLAAAPWPVRLLACQIRMVARRLDALEAEQEELYSQLRALRLALLEARAGELT